MWTLQHRGQENSGIVSSNGKRLFCHKGQGLVSHVYSEGDIKKLKGYIAIGHNRYSTFGKANIDHSQPVHQPLGHLALAHNGNLPTVSALKKHLKNLGIQTAGLNDSEMMYKAIEHKVVSGAKLADAVESCTDLFTGAYCLLIMSKNKLIAVRDRYGIRPLSIGKINGSYVVASETCAIKGVGATFIRDIEPGEMVIIDSNGITSKKLYEAQLNLDVFELIYFARPDSVMFGKSIYEIRKNLGKELANEFTPKIDVIIPVPDSAMPAAIGYSEQAQIPLDQALVKNRYIHRTFIKPSTKQRQTSVKMKLNIIPEMVVGKRVGIIDDSIVRGTTSKHLVDLVKECNPKEIHMLIPSPPVKYPDFYGIDTPNQSDLIAANMSLEEMTKYIGVYSLTFLSLKGMLKAIGIDEKYLCTSCFTGNYPIEIGKQNLRRISK